MPDYFRKPVAAICPDGAVRRVLARAHCCDGSLAGDTYFSVPAYARVRGATVRGYVTGCEMDSGPGLEFHPFDANPWPSAPGHRYEVASMDYCAPGFERLRNQDEFILCAYPAPGAGWRALQRDWLQDIESCDRPDGFDYPAARRAVRAYCSKLRDAWRGRRNPLGVEHTPDNEESAPVLLYVRDTRPDGADGQDS